MLFRSVPLYLVLGNHEGEQGWLLNGTADNTAVRAANARKLYYPNPVPDAFYTGNSREEPLVGLRGNYYAWEWGAALFVVLDPYWYTLKKPGKTVDNWAWTLGRDQYDWFRKTLENSTAAFKFVFCHQLVGGGDNEGRGGIEDAGYYEWGGNNADGTWGFDDHRPGWEKPIHQLMVENGVTVFFHGHDHFYARQELDGVIYQLVPQPGHPNFSTVDYAAEYGYEKGDIVPNSGHLLVTVRKNDARIDYIRSYLASNETATRKNGDVSRTYTVSAGLVTGQAEETGLPRGFSLEQNTPNPFNHMTTIQYSLAAAGGVRLNVYDSLGRIVKNILNEYQPAGHYSVSWDGRDARGRTAGSGMYVYSLVAGSRFETRRMIMMK